MAPRKDHHCEILWLSNLDIPVHLLAIPESVLQGFNDEALDVERDIWIAPFQ